MAVDGEGATDSGQGSGNAGYVDELSRAISAATEAHEREAVEAPETEAPEVKEPDASVKGAEDKRTDEDAAAAKVAKPEASKDEGEKKDAPVAFEAPKHWPEADRVAFTGLDPKAQELIKRLAKDLEGGFTRKSQELGDKAKFADTVRNLIDPTTKQQIARSGMDEAQYVGYLNQLQQFASQRPVEYVKWAMTNLGVRPEHLGIPAKQPEQPAQPDLTELLADPKVKVLEQQLAELTGKLTSRERAEQEWQQRQVHAQRQSLMNVAAQFRNAIDDSGQLQHPHFDTIQRHMGALMETDPELSRMPDGEAKMKAAYDMAVWARPDLRQSLVEAEASKRAQAMEKAREAARAKTVAAVKPARSIQATTTKPKTLDDIIRDAMGKHAI